MTTVFDRARLPTGTVTFMFTDVEGSTLIAQRVGDERFAHLLEEHNRLISGVVKQVGGLEVGSEGDAVFAVFTDPLAAVSAARGIQSRLLEGAWGGEEPMQVRIGVHTGNGVLGGSDYVGVDVHRASRIAAAGNGGQILLSEVTARLVEDRLEDGIEVGLLGRYRLSGFAEPEPLYQLGAPGRSAPELRVPKAESRLPLSLSDFIGREVEVAAGLELLDEHRLITLTGPGGTGKTRLALEIARRDEPKRADGAYLVSLASLRDISLVPRAILDEVGVETAGGVDPLEHLMRWIRDRDVLIVLDNFEQLSDGSGLVSDMLSAAPRLCLLVTSRAPLRLSGERELPVPPLGVPAPEASLPEATESDGVRLFVSRASAVRPGFAVTDENVGILAAIVRALDGLPLAIELAASRVRSLTPEVILERMGNQILASRITDLPSRQQTIVNAIGWSYDLLGPELQRLFEGLSVFAGTFGLREADEVCGEVTDVLEGITDLVEQSLLRQVSDIGQPRYSMLTVVREFALGALQERGEDRQFQDRHALVFTELAERAQGEILSSAQGRWLAVLAEEHDNLRAAFDHATNREDPPTALRLAAALWRFWQIRGHLVEGLQRIESALALAGEDHQLLRARALTGQGGLLYWKGDWSATLPPYRQALDLFRAWGDEGEIAEALYNMSFPVGYSGDVDDAVRLLRESLELSERIGRAIGVGRAHWGQANMSDYEGRWESAIESLDVAVEELSRIDAPFDLGWAWFMLAYNRLRLGQVELSKEPERKALEIFARVGDVSALALIFEMVGLIALREDDRPRAAHILGAAHRIKVDTGVALGDVEMNRYEEVDEFLHLMDDVHRAYFDEGYNAPREESVEKALATLSRDE